MKITSKSRKLIGIFNAIIIGVLILLQTFMILLKCDKSLEFFNIGIFQWLWDQDALFLCSNLITSLLLLFSIMLLVMVFDVATSQESDHFHVGSRSYSNDSFFILQLPIYLLFVSFMLCLLSYILSLRASAELDLKMTKLLMNNYLEYGVSRESRRLVDRIHVEYSCCGVKSIDDFVDLSEIDSKLPTLTKLWPCTEWEYCGVPLSCCKSISCSQRTKLLNDGWDTINITDKWFNRNGCVEKMDNAFLFLNYPNSVLTDFIMILVLGFHICSIVLSQIHVTASATLHGAHLETSQSSYAWLIDIGQPDRKSLIKILNPDLPPSDIEVPSNIESHIEGETGTTTQIETNNVTETEKLPTLVSILEGQTEGTGTIGTTTGTSTGTTSNIVVTTSSVDGKVTESSSTGASTGAPSTNNEAPTEKNGENDNDSDGGVTTENLGTEKTESSNAVGGGGGAKKQKGAKAKKPKTGKASKNQGKKNQKKKPSKKASGPSKGKNTKTKTKKGGAKKNTQKKKPAAKPKKK
ncbi:hypothetical protein CAEBREN_08767 [Caenorhabditis brenneri]|uniref:Uncharacterized protein n=1 Tax=Caenorhabditis brenneri TaxID=135651 RepID=G0PGK9_CAEBE|nr:hypothetical protein CAEBREN_08767 [Caenorhabditis brenneri]